MRHSGDVTVNNGRYSNSTYRGNDNLIHYLNVPFAWCDAYEHRDDIRRQLHHIGRVVTCIKCLASKLCEAAWEP